MTLFFCAMHFAGYVLCVTCLSEYGIYGEGIYVEESISVKLNFKNSAVSISKCNKVEFIRPVGLEVKSVFRKEEFGRAFPA